MTWNDFLIYLNAHNVTETDFWIFVALSVIGIVILIFAWRSWAVIRRENKIPDGAAFFCAGVLTCVIAPLLLMGLVHLIQFFI